MEKMIPMLRKVVGGLSAAMVVIGALMMFIGWILMLFSKDPGYLNTAHVFFNGGNSVFFPGFLILGYWVMNTQPPADAPQQ